MASQIVYSGNPRSHLPDFAFKKEQLQKKGLLLGHNAEQTIENKQNTFAQEKRNTLVQVLKEQYSSIDSPKAQNQIQKLSSNNTFTITTGQQIHIFLGPMYVHNKILSTIHQAARLKEQFPHREFIPVFWMATEDHDMDEIDHVYFLGEKHTWAHQYKGISGKCPTRGLVSFMQDMVEGKNDISQEYKELFSFAYENFSTLANATRYLVDYLYGEQGVLVIDADDPRLKKEFKSEMAKDILNGSFNAKINAQTDDLKEEGIKGIISPRETNHFFIDANGLRKRIDKNENGFTTSDGSLNWNHSQMQEAIDQETEKFSPNVALRPLYQECILPNIMYLAGPSEYVYWLQIQKTFESVPNPILKLRNTYIYVPQKTWNKISKYPELINDLFEPEDVFEKQTETILLGINPVDEVLAKQRRLICSDLAELKKKNVPNLKQVHSISTKYLSEMESFSQAFSNDRKEHPETKQKLDSFIKIKRQFFNHMNKWERKTYFFEEAMLRNIRTASILGTQENYLIHIFCG